MNENVKVFSKRWHVLLSQVRDTCTPKNCSYLGKNPNTAVMSIGLARLYLE
jgi:hypothetical protein